ncbi:hypothetical protein L0V05_07780 [Tabrizicola sp. J26]|uniref:hypothetical protein n=1 Tax=Alitabrizicola rongguiensis TaxID=2909234 RepID=UPI001F44FADE|nr:hypothetical protein [Tabrizicola rongguiensis]MCF1708713.1 hypothetical protein [Tabrizicola rongguiensis]
MSNVPKVDVENLREINAALPLRKISDQIDRLALSADVKSLVMDLARVTVAVGDVVLQIGRKILTVVFEILARFPNTVFGVVISVAVGLLVASIPFIGATLSAFLMPLLVAFGLTRGAIADFANASWTSRINELEARLARVGA